MFVKCCPMECKVSTSAKKKKKPSVYILIWFRSWKLRKKWMLNLRGGHTLLSPRIVFMLPFEDLLRLGIVTPPSSRAWIRAVCPWRLLLVNRSYPPTLLITAPGEDEWIKNRKALKMSERCFSLWYFNEVAAYGNQEIPHSGKEKGFMLICSDTDCFPSVKWCCACVAVQQQPQPVPPHCWAWRLRGGFGKWVIESCSSLTWAVKVPFTGIVLKALPLTTASGVVQLSVSSSCTRSGLWDKERITTFKTCNYS